MSLYIITRCLCEEPKSHLWPGPVRGVPRAGSRRPPTRLKGLTGSSSSSFDNLFCLFNFPFDCLHLVILSLHFPFCIVFLCSFFLILIIEISRPLLLQVSQFMFGGLAGTLCWLSVLPFDVIKSRMQVGQPQFLNPQKKRKKI